MPVQSSWIARSGPVGVRRHGAQLPGLSRSRSCLLLGCGEASGGWWGVDRPGQLTSPTESERRQWDLGLPAPSGAEWERPSPRDGEMTEGPSLHPFKMS